jgi:hypothetical protein
MTELWCKTDRRYRGGSGRVRRVLLLRWSVFLMTKLARWSSWRDVTRMGGVS